MTKGNVADLLTSAAGRWPGGRALVDTTSGTTLTWAELDDAVRAKARALRAAGVGKGDRVALRLPTSSGFAVALFAVLRTGAIAVPMSPQAPAAELLSLLGDSGARVLIGADPGELPDPITVLPADPFAGTSGADDPEPDGGGEDIAVLSYTSGTTGPPRGVLLSHRALLANVEQLGALRPSLIDQRDRLLVAIPLFHLYGLGPGLLHATSRGATMVLAERFDARRALAACVEHRVTVIAGVPAMYAEFADLPTDELGAALSTVRRMTSGAAPLHPKILAVIRKATGLGVWEGYGLTETGPALTTTLVTGYPKPGSVGRPIPGIELRLVGPDGVVEGASLDPDDPDDAFDSDGGTGLVSVRGANLFSGYWPDRAHGPDADGWFRTGDVGYLDADGDLHLVDRANDLIIVNGFNVYPREIEEVIAGIPGVAEVAVVGVLDERSGEAVKAVVVPAPGAALSEQQITDQCTGRLAGYKVPRLVEFAEELPHSVTGKIRRNRLRLTS